MAQDETDGKTAISGGADAESKAMRDRWSDPEFRRVRSDAIKRGQAAGRLRREQEKDEG